jgi:hypothetical protein
MTKEEIMKERVEKNLKVLKLLKNNDATISAEEKRAILNEYTGWGGLRDAIYTPSIYKELKKYLSPNISIINIGDKNLQTAILDSRVGSELWRLILYLITLLIIIEMIISSNAVRKTSS